jgi:hypothetical protein
MDTGKPFFKASDGDWVDILGEKDVEVTLKIKFITPLHPPLI